MAQGKIAEILRNQITDEQEVKGNLVQSRVINGGYYSYLILIFDDGKWAVYSADIYNYDDCYIEFVSDEPFLDALVKVGLFTQKSLDRYKQYKVGAK